MDWSGRTVAMLSGLSRVSGLFCCSSVRKAFERSVFMPGYARKDSSQFHPAMDSKGGRTSVDDSLLSKLIPVRHSENRRYERAKILTCAT